MIPFFRKIRKKLADDNKPLKYLRYAIGEIVLVVIGILIALQINNWNQEKKEKQKEIAYIKSLIDDINSDVIQSENILEDFKELDANLDELLRELSNENIFNDSNKAFQLWFYNFGIPDFVSNDKTLVLLKNSGGFELITNNEVLDAIWGYDKAVKVFINQNETMATAMVTSNSYSRCFNVIKLTNPIENQFPIPLLSKDEEALNIMYTNRLLWKYGMLSVLNYLQDVQNKGKETILVLKSNYNL
jgi:hypothetical protein